MPQVLLDKVIFRNFTKHYENKHLDKSGNHFAYKVDGEDFTIELDKSEKVISMLKGNYKTRGVFVIDNELVEVYQRIDKKLIIYQEPYLLVLKNEK